MKKIRILLADDHGLVRRGARAVLQSQRGWKVVGEAATGREAVEKAIELKPDVAVIDIGMPELDGVEAARQIKQALPDTKILMLTMHESDQIVRRALNAGAQGYLLKSDLTDCLTKAVKCILEGQYYLTPKVTEIMMGGFLEPGSKPRQAENPKAQLTPREVQIVGLLAAGQSNKEIAALLGITVRTVETHRARIMLKLGLHSLAGVIHYAMRSGITPMLGN